MSDLIPLEQIESKILLIRNQNVILDSDLADLYGVTTKVFNQAVKRNEKRFPKDFMFKLTRQEFTHLRSQIVTSNVGRGGRRYMPNVFTEHGAIMAATILNASKAIEISVYVVRAFVKMRHLGKVNIEIESAFEEIRQKLDCHDEDIGTLFEMLQMLLISSKTHSKKSNKKIGFHS